MLTTHANEIKAVQKALRHGPPADEAVLASLDVLAERLDRLKHSSPLFAGVAFSEHVARVIGPRPVAVAV